MWGLCMVAYGVVGVSLIGMKKSQNTFIGYKAYNILSSNGTATRPYILSLVLHGAVRLTLSHVFVCHVLFSLISLVTVLRFPVTSLSVPPPLSYTPVFQTFHCFYLICTISNLTT